MTLPEAKGYAQGLSRFLRNNRKRPNRKPKTAEQISAELARLMRPRGATVINYIDPKQLPQPEETS